MNATHSILIARLADCLSTTTLCQYVLTVDGEDYAIIDDGDCRYAVELLDIETWLDAREDAAADYSADFCQDVEIVRDEDTLAELATMLLAPIGGLDGDAYRKVAPRA